MPHGEYEVNPKECAARHPVGQPQGVGVGWRGAGSGIWSRWSQDGLSGGCGAGKVGSGARSGVTRAPRFPGLRAARGASLGAGAAASIWRAGLQEGLRGRRGLGGPGRGFQTEPHSSRKSERRAPGGAGKGAGGRGGLVLPRRGLRDLKRKWLNPWAGFHRGPGPVVEDLPTPLTPRERPTDAGKGPLGLLIFQALMPVRSLGLPPPHFSERIHFTTGDIQEAPLRVRAWTDRRVLVCRSGF